MGLEGRVALVTGAGGEGIGRSAALSLARDGADVIVNYRRSRDGADAVCGAIQAMGRRAVAVAADVADAAAVHTMFEQARSAFGHVDIVVNSAGGAWKPQDVTEILPAHLRAVLAAEIEATYHLLREALPAMRDLRWGRFVSVGGHMADDWRFGPPEAPLDYPLGKAGRHWLTRTMAPREFPRGITINAVAPGPTRRLSLDEAVRGVESRGGDAADHGSPQRVAEVIAFLCSDAAAGVTGAVIPVPGERPV